MYRGLWCVALALATSATAGLLPPLPEPEPTSDFNPDFPLRLLPPMPIQAIAGALLPGLFPASPAPPDLTGSCNPTATTAPTTSTPQTTLTVQTKPAIETTTTAHTTSTTQATSAAQPTTVVQTTSTAQTTPGVQTPAVQTAPSAQTTSSSSSTSVKPHSGVKSGSQVPSVGSSSIFTPINSTATTNYCQVLPSGTASGPYWLDQQDHTGNGRGYAPYVKTNANYPVYRNVLTYGVKNDGSANQTAALQNVIDTDGQGDTRHGHGTTYEPAEVYLPPGIYTLGGTLNLRLGTVVTGDPSNPAIIKASSDFLGDTLVNGQDPAAGHPETTFMIALRNVVLDTTAITTSQKITALQWGIGQACALSNVAINMGQGASSQTGIWMNGGSAIAVTDVTIFGGGIGIQSSNQQVNFKNIYIKGSRTCFAATGGWTVVLQGVTFDSCGLGIDMTMNQLGSLVLLDSTARNTGIVVQTHDSSRDSGPRNSQLLIDNLSHDAQNPIVVWTNGTTQLGALDHVGTFLIGNDIPDLFQAGTNYTTLRPQVLLDQNNRFFTKAAPNYDAYTADRVVNVKQVSGYPVMGDGRTDDSANLNAILKQNAANCALTYIPYGVYLLKDTLFIPANTRIVGEAWPVLSGSGAKFSDANHPLPVVKIGNIGDLGVVEIQDIRFTVAEVSPGAIIVEVNIAGLQAGDVGIWNSLITVGGTADTTISSICTNQDTQSCMAAFMMMHLTATSSAYIENLWGWTADHDLDGSTTDRMIISTGRGLLVESSRGTWLTGTSFEHNWLYQYNIPNAQNIFAGMLQTETPYMQGVGAIQTVPAPWTVMSTYHDPDYAWCGASDQSCRSALATNVDGGANIHLYGSAAWTFFDGPWDGLYDKPCPNGVCQTNMMRVANTPGNLVWNSISTKSTDVMVLDGEVNPTQYNNPGGWGGVIQRYRQFAA